MKTMLVCSERKINNHIGEYYDEIIEVPHQPVTKNIEESAKHIRESIRSLWKKDVEDEEREGEPCIQVNLDAASPYNAMLIDYQIVVGTEEKIKLELPYLKTTERTTEDREALEVIEKLNNRGKENVEI